MPELTIKPGVIVVASAFPDPPFEVEIDGADSGFDAELMQAICRPLGLTWRLDAVSGSEAARSISFEETAAGSSLDWHNAPHRQYVITLSGRLEFETRKGEKQVVEPGDVLLAEDTAGGGHRWRLIDEQPWRRAYVQVT